VWLGGARAGRSEVFADQLWGYPDNLSLGSDGLIWVAMPGPRVAMLEAIQRTPAVIRSLARRVPERWQPVPDPAVGVAALDDSGRTVHLLTGTVDGLPMLTGVRESGGTLWLAN
jgi:sugar lactone lactonase YvrE